MYDNLNVHLHSQQPISSASACIHRRKAVDDDLGDDLIKFYGSKVCVFRKEPRLRPNINLAEWHHLDCNSANTIFENIVPLGGDLHNQLHSKMKSPGYFADGLGAQDIENAGLWHYQNNIRSCAYGCWRVGAFLYRMSDLPKDKVFALEMATLALEALLSSKRLGLARDTVERSILPLLYETDSYKDDHLNWVRARVATDVSDFLKVSQLPYVTLELIALADGLLNKVTSAHPKKGPLAARLFYHRAETLVALRQNDKAAVFFIQAQERLKRERNVWGRPQIAIQAAYTHPSPKAAEKIIEQIEKDFRSVQLETQFGRDFHDEFISALPWIIMMKAQIEFILRPEGTRWIGLASEAYQLLKEQRQSAYFSGQRWAVITAYERRKVQKSERIQWRSPNEMESFLESAMKVSKKLSDGL